jgi:hypothetical protein
LSYSRINGRNGNSFADATTIEFNEFRCRSNCIVVSGDFATVRDNRIGADLLCGLWIIGNHNKIIDNIISSGSESNYLV